MFFAALILPIYLSAIIAMCFMGSGYKAMMFMVLLLVASFLLFLFVMHPFPSVLSVMTMMSLYGFRPKD